MLCSQISACLHSYRQVAVIQWCWFWCLASCSDVWALRSFQAMKSSFVYIYNFLYIIIYFPWWRWRERGILELLCPLVHLFGLCPNNILGTSQQFATNLVWSMMIHHHELDFFFFFFHHFFMASVTMRAYSYSENRNGSAIYSELLIHLQLNLFWW